MPFSSGSQVPAAASALAAQAPGRRNHRNWTTCAPFLDDLLDDLSRPIRRGHEGSRVRKSGFEKGLRLSRQTPLLVDGRLGRLGHPFREISCWRRGAGRMKAEGLRMKRKRRFDPQSSPRASAARHRGAAPRRNYMAVLDREAVAGDRRQPDWPSRFSQFSHVLRRIAPQPARDWHSDRVHSRRVPGPADASDVAPVASTPTVRSEGPKAPWQSGDSAALPAKNASRRKPTPHPPTKGLRDVARGAEGGAVTTAPLRGLLTGVGMAEIGFLRCAKERPFA